jgi:hypothetical protein
MHPTLSYAHADLPATLSHLIAGRFGDRLGELAGAGGGVAALEAAVRVSFTSAAELAAPLLRGRADFTRADIHLLDDWSTSSPTTLAGFSPAATAESGVACFQFSSRVMLDAFYLGWGLTRAGQPQGAVAPSLKSIWLHEFVHLADWGTLQAFDEAAADVAPAGDGRRGFFVESRSAFGDLGRLPVAWALLHVIGHFRNEGLANLYEHLMTGTQPTSLDGPAAHAAFRRLLNAVFPALALESGDGVQATARQALEALHVLGYAAGPWLVLDTLAGRTPVAAERAARCLGSPDPATRFSPQEAAEFVAPLLAVDVSGFLRALLDPAAPHPWGAFLTADEALNAFHAFLLGGPQSAARGTLVARASLAARQGNRDAFVAAVASVAGEGPGPEEIRRRCDQFLSWPAGGSSVNQRYFELLGRIYGAWRRAPEPVGQAVLTYALMEQDLVPDEMPFVGRLDDVLLMEAGLALARG